MKRKLLVGVGVQCRSAKDIERRDLGGKVGRKIYRADEDFDNRGPPYYYKRRLNTTKASRPNPSVASVEENAVPLQVTRSHTLLEKEKKGKVARACRPFKHSWCSGKLLRLIKCRGVH